MAKKSLFFKREVKRIKDVKETLKALEKISSANLHFWRKIQRIQKEYDEKLKMIISDFGEFEIESPFFKENNVGKELKVVFSVEGKFCGKILNPLLDFVGINLKKDDEVLITGERGKNLLEKRNIKVNYFFKMKREIPTEKDIREIKDLIISGFLKKKWRKIVVFYIEFESLASQNPKAFEFLPFDFQSLREKIKEKKLLGSPIFEPSREKIFNFLIKEYLEFTLYEKILETKLSELVARSVSLEEAGEKADELISQINLQFLRTKRESITKEVTELFSHKILIKR
jgi:F-type H+-transporting ATPase subunit gamma